jgi:hypothetical protein
MNLCQPPWLNRPSTAELMISGFIPLSHHTFRDQFGSTFRCQRDAYVNHPHLWLPYKEIVNKTAVSPLGLEIGIFMSTDRLSTETHLSFFRVVNRFNIKF